MEVFEIWADFWWDPCIKAGGRKIVNFLLRAKLAKQIT